ncbi:hypothetical protein [Paracraurococcus lichenis]|uniref:Uncharacterized protein n=1 Tax=Paracraurococcus lichenis TaxID=3064888 RepID=A0ABT9EAV5_9PROT|nr:hypothetical protein [Paracraurococcus sp. LOR1-02]MDO9713332.1 hypothetical protein [Paracraurococcus sp. LOR1-02]
MRLSDKVYLQNQWFDRLPLQQQFLAAWWCAWGGLLTMLILNLFFGIRFLPMLLIVLAVVMTPRLMFKFDLLDVSPGLPPRDQGPPTRIAVRGPGWVYRLNAWFDRREEYARILVVAFATLACFVLNMLLYWRWEVPVGLLLMLALLVLGWARVLHVQGWLAPREA